MTLTTTEPDQEVTHQTLRSRVSGAARSASILIGLVLLCLVFSLASPRFLTFNNLINIVGEASVVGLLALGMTFVLILAGIDLSVGSTVTLTTVVLGVALVSWSLPGPLALVLAVMTGTVVGLTNGLVIAFLRVPPLIATLGILSIVQSVASLITGGAITSIRGASGVTFLGQGRLGPVPVPGVLLILAAIACWTLSEKTTFGTKIKAIGANERASQLMGLPVAGYTIAVYSLAGTLAGIAGIIFAARLSASSSQAGVGLELPAIAAAVLGGTSLSGGAGSIGGSLAGALFLSVLLNGLILVGVPFVVQLVVTGVVMIVAIMLNQWFVDPRGG